MDYSRLYHEEISSTNKYLTPRGQIVKKNNFPTLESPISNKTLNRVKSTKVFFPKQKSRPSILTIKQELIEILSKINKKQNKAVKIKLIFQALEYFTKESDVFYNELKIILEGVYDAMFCEKSEIPTDIKNKIYEAYDFFAADLQKSIPFCFVSEALNEVLQNERMKNHENSKEIAKLHQIIEEKSRDIEFFQEKIKKINNTELKEKIVMVENVNMQVMQDKINLEENLAIKEQIIQDLYQEIKEKDEAIKAKCFEIKLKTQESEEFLKNSIKLKEKLKETSSEKNRAIEYTKVLMQKLKKMRENNEEYEKKIRDAENKNKILSVRAAEGFENLTLRPNLEEINFVFMNSKVENTTRAKVGFLISLYKDMLKKKKHKRVIKLSSRKSSTDSLIYSRQNSRGERVYKLDH